MAIVKNLVVVMGEYQDREGKTKKEYRTIGKLVTKDDGKEFVKIDVIPVARNGFANVYSQQKKKKNGEDDNDVPQDISGVPQNDDDLPF